MEREQTEKSKVTEKLHEQKETNKSLIGELNKARVDLVSSKTEVTGLQRRLDGSYNEIK